MRLTKRQPGTCPSPSHQHPIIIKPQTSSSIIDNFQLPPFQQDWPWPVHKVFSILTLGTKQKPCSTMHKTAKQPHGTKCNNCATRSNNKPWHNQQWCWWFHQCHHCWCTGWLLCFYCGYNKINKWQWSSDWWSKTQKHACLQVQATTSAITIWYYVQHSVFSSMSTIFFILKAWSNHVSVKWCWWYHEWCHHSHQSIVINKIPCS